MIAISSLRPRRVLASKRLAAALCASCVIHAWVALDASSAHRVGVRSADVQALRVTLVSEAVAEPRSERSMVAVADTRGDTPQARPLHMARTRHVINTAAARPPGTALAAVLPDVTDPNYYTARDIDVYPVLLAPREWSNLLEMSGGSSTGALLLNVRIDEVGGVAKVVVLESDSPEAFEASMRAALSSAVFSAARKDGRAVKSEIVVRVSFGATADFARNGP